MKSESSLKHFKADLHCHSTCSDGTCTPFEILDLAKKIGLRGLSITDHDSVLAYPAALEKAKELDLYLIPGVEFSSHHKNQSVHILAYSFDYTHPAIHALCEKHKRRRLDRNLKILDKLKTVGFLIDPEELLALSFATLGRPHIAYLMMQKKYVPDIATAFKLYLGDGKKCYVAGDQISLEETLATIKTANGLAVLAHPHLYNSYKTVKKLLEFSFDGLECSYANMTLEQNQPWIELAKEKNLMITGGSDFHGDVKPTIQLGATSIPWELFVPLLTHHS